MLWTAHERSFFAFEPELVQHVWCRPFGSLWLLGRALLTLCAWPWAGSLVMSLLLTGTAWCLAYVTRLHRHPLWHWVAYIPSAAWIAWLSYYGFDTFFKSEPGRIFGIPALCFIIVLIQLTFIKSFSRKPLPALIKNDPNESQLHNIVNNTVPLAIIVLAMAFEWQCRPWVRPTCSMERCYASCDWQGIVDIAHANRTTSNRTMAAYYAIALVRQQAILKNLFDIRFEYDETFMHDYGGETMNNTPYYIFDADLHAGLVQFAYHKAIEDMTVDGLSNHNLKAMVQVTAMRGEKKLCHKYLSILGRTPGNADFIDKWTAYIENTDLMEQDPMVAGIRLLEPVEDGFESAYTEPAFLGYNLLLTSGRSRYALENSIAVCLYTKLNEPFLERAQYLGMDGITQNPIVMDALAMQAVKRPEILKAVPQLRYHVDRYRMFAQHLKNIGATGDTEQRMPFAEKEFNGSNIGYYPYYYYLGNMGATTKGAAEKYGFGQSDGVN